MTTADYVPPAGAWERRAPAEMGFYPAALDDAINFSRQNESPWPRDMAAAIALINAVEGENGAIIGPIKDRGGVSGLVTRRGYIIAEWGEPDRVDMTFSVSKSYLATIAGLALDRGLIRDLDDPICATVEDPGFASPHNAAITWRHMLHQTSEWHGTLFGKPDSVDANRATAGAVAPGVRGEPRVLQAPGKFWEYNDVRVNQLGVALLRRWGRSLPNVLKEHIMDPIDASDTWQWHGYRNSTIEVGGQPIESVTGGGHWGGGVWVNTFDHARFGLLHLRRGEWGGRRLLSERWLQIALTPNDLNPSYGCMWWLNTDRLHYPSLPASSFFGIGAGTSLVWVEPERELVVVVRWIDSTKVDAFASRVLAAVRE